MPRNRYSAVKTYKSMMSSVQILLWLYWYPFYLQIKGFTLSSHGIMGSELSRQMAGLHLAGPAISLSFSTLYNQRIISAQSPPNL